MNNMKNYIIMIVVICSIEQLKAQPEVDPDAGTGVPIDGGIVTVTLIAAAYGAKRKSKQNKESNDDI